MSKPFRELSDAELQTEFALWDKKVREAKGWGASLMQAAKWRDACKRIMLERGLIDKLEPSVRHG